MELSGKTFMVTGAAGGIGGAICAALDAQGANLLLVGRNRANLETLSSKLKGNTQVLEADLSDDQAIQALSQRVAETDGIDGVVNVAGVMDFNLFERQDAACLNQLFTVNALAPMKLTQALLPELQKKTQALVVNVGSIFGSIGHPGFVAYCASKAALASFSQGLARELADGPVSVLYVAPRAVATDFNTAAINALNAELGNAADDPERVAAAVVAAIQGEIPVTYMGWPEKLFVRLNALLTSVVTSALVKKLPVVKKYLA